MTIVSCALYLRVAGQDKIRMDGMLVNASHSSRLATGVRSYKGLHGRKGKKGIRHRVSTIFT